MRINTKMKKIPLKYIILIATVLVTIGTVGRLIPHLSNATPVAAAAIFAGFLLGWRYAIAVPIIIMLISDFFIGFYEPSIMISVYFSFAIIGLMGLIARKNEKFETFIAGGVVGSIIFFLVTNGAVWFFGTMYPPTFDGLIMSYTMAIPFFRNMLMGDFFYISTFYGAYKASIFLMEKNRLKKIALPQKITLSASA